MSKLESCLWGLDFVIGAIGYLVGGPYAGLLCLFAAAILIFVGLTKKDEIESKERASSVLVDYANRPYSGTPRIKKWHKWGMAVSLFGLVVLISYGVIKHQSHVENVENGKNNPSLPITPPQQQAATTQSVQPLKEEKKSQPSKSNTPKNKSNGGASDKPPKGEPSPDTTTETYSTEDSVHTNAHHVGTKDEAKAVVNRGGLTQGPVAIAPNGIANAAPNYGNQTVVNPTPPLPHVTWTQEQLRPGVGLDASGMFSLTPEYVRKLQLRKDNPGVMVRLSTDGSFTNAAFAAECDKPCEGVEAHVGNGLSSVGQGNASERIALMGVAMPGTVNAGQTVTWEVRSETAEPITIKQIQPVKAK